MATISKLKVGQVLYERRRQKMGNTTVSRTVVFDVVVREVHADKGFMVASWNHNSPRRYYAREVAKLLVSKPKPKGMILGLPTY